LVLCLDGFIDFFGKAFNAFDRERSLGAFDFDNIVRDQLMRMSIHQMGHEVNKQEAGFVNAADQYPVRAEFFSKRCGRVGMIEKIPEATIGFFPGVGVDLDWIITALPGQGFLKQGLDRIGTLEFFGPARVEGEVV